MTSLHTELVSFRTTAYSFRTIATKYVDQLPAVALHPENQKLSRHRLITLTEVSVSGTVLKHSFQQITLIKCAL
jgi:hypothetical protein